MRKRFYETYGFYPEDYGGKIYIGEDLTLAEIKGQDVVAINCNPKYTRYVCEKPRTVRLPIDKVPPLAVYNMPRRYGTVLLVTRSDQLIGYKDTEGVVHLGDITQIPNANDQTFDQIMDAFKMPTTFQSLVNAVYRKLVPKYLERKKNNPEEEVVIEFSDEVKQEIEFIKTHVTRSYDSKMESMKKIHEQSLKTLGEKHAKELAEFVEVNEKKCKVLQDKLQLKEKEVEALDPLYGWVFENGRYYYKKPIVVDRVKYKGQIKLLNTITDRTVTLTQLSADINFAQVLVNYKRGSDTHPNILSSTCQGTLSGKPIHYKMQHMPSMLEMINLDSSYQSEFRDYLQDNFYKGDKSETWTDKIKKPTVPKPSPTTTPTTTSTTTTASPTREADSGYSQSPTASEVTHAQFEALIRQWEEERGWSADTQRTRSESHDGRYWSV